MATIRKASDGVWEIICPCGRRGWTYTKSEALSARKQGVKCKGCGKRL